MVCTPIGLHLYLITRPEPIRVRGGSGASETSARVYGEQRAYNSLQTRQKISFLLMEQTNQQKEWENISIKKMFHRTLVWAAGKENISLAWLGLVTSKLAGLGWLLMWLGSGGLCLGRLQLELASWLLDGMG